ncbi:SGNH/GDSL hydrolase family protein [Paenibacillus spongiae]|uniref:SGNH/GDSL hydrolase family protein n=1 Tax=Paenibacillus spongiae TaxID=2909671 RepID=A0ABY5S9V4_9BACL|nr:SGNH/GDSL hydrolase family protein [Paenibacillus spongiae]UVI30699.1 SGNH/GDSL hydrolase family protein [Paenibacillus spongiae]
MSTELAAAYVWHSPLETPYIIAGFPWLQAEGKYRRLPIEPAFPLPSAVDNLANHTAGGQIRFRTNSPKLAIKVRLAGPAYMYHMAATGQCGFDCYEELDGTLHYRSTAVFDTQALEYEAVLFEGGSAETRTIVLNFPLYQGVEEVSVGLEAGASVEAPPAYDPGTILVYGTSITQGGCASRPGLCYTNVLSRRINRAFVNLGFSGSGKGEPELAHILATIPDPACLVLDYEANSVSPELYAQTLPEFIRIYREAHPKVPILVLSRIYFAKELFDAASREMQETRKRMQMELVHSLQNAGDRNIHFYDGEKLLSRHAQECCVDGVHPTDLGFMQMADNLEPVLRRLISRG